MKPNPYPQIAPRAIISKVRVVETGYWEPGVIGRGTESPEGEELSSVNKLST